MARFGWRRGVGNHGLAAPGRGGCQSITLPYQPGRRSRHWIKTPIRRRGRFAIGGYGVSRAGRDAVSSLLVGGFDDTGDLIYCGRITSGLSERARRTLYAELALMRRTHSPFRTGPEVTYDAVRWVEPVVVARIEYREFTGRLRHAAFKGVERADPPGRGGASAAVTHLRGRRSGSWAERTGAAPPRRFVGALRDSGVVGMTRSLATAAAVFVVGLGAQRRRPQRRRGRSRRCPRPHCSRRSMATP